jgi:hypothetical protein
MGVDENKVLVRRFYEEVWDKGNVAFAHQVFTDDYVRHDLRPSQAEPGPAGQARIAADFRQAFPDLRFDVNLVLGEGGAGCRPLDGNRNAHEAVGLARGDRQAGLVLRGQHLSVRERQGRRDLESPR